MLVRTAVVVGHFVAPRALRAWPLRLSGISCTVVRARAARPGTPSASRISTARRRASYEAVPPLSRSRIGSSSSRPTASTPTSFGRADVWRSSRGAAGVAPSTMPGSGSWGPKSSAPSPSPCKPPPALSAPSDAHSPGASRRYMVGPTMNYWLCTIGDRDALWWVLSEQRMAFPMKRRRRTLDELEAGDALYLYTTRGAFGNPTRDRGRVIGRATADQAVRPLDAPFSSASALSQSVVPSHCGSLPHYARASNWYRYARN